MAAYHGATAETPDFLSKNERERYQSISSVERRKRWMRGRLAAKHLFLTRAGSQDGRQRSPWPPRINWLGWAELQDFPQWAYRQVEILPHHPKCSNLPRVS